MNLIYNKYMNNKFNTKSNPKPPLQKEARIVLSMNEDQARANVAALDFFSRITTGQIDVLTQLIEGGDIPMMSGGQCMRMGDDSWAHKVALVRGIVKELKVVMGHNTSSGNGVGHLGTVIESHRAYELQKVLSKAISDAKDASCGISGGSETSSCSVDRDGLFVRYTRDPAPTAKVE